VITALGTKEFQLGFALHPPVAGEQGTLVAGLRLKKGQHLEQSLREAAKNLHSSGGSEMRFDVASAGAIKIHALQLARENDTAGRLLLGTNPIYFAFREEGLIVGMGEKGLPALQKALRARPQVGPVVLAEVSLKRLVWMLGQEYQQAAQTAFGKSENTDRVQLTVKGGKALRLNLTFHPAVLRFLSLVGAQPGSTKP
jgi:hypothetical protein